MKTEIFRLGLITVIYILIGYVWKNGYEAPSMAFIVALLYIAIFKLADIEEKLTTNLPKGDE